MRLVAELCPDLLGALPQPPRWIKVGVEVEKGKEGKGVEGPLQCVKCIDASTIRKLLCTSDLNILSLSNKQCRRVEPGEGHWESLTPLTPYRKNSRVNLPIYYALYEQ